MQPSDITLVTAYSHDYTVGKLCASVNRCYAQTHGYGFLCEEFDCDEIAALISPKLHFTWYKICVLQAVMNGIVAEEAGECKYLMWVDADAVVVDSHQRLEDIIQEASYREFIIAEDMHVGNLLNAGIFLLKVCPWSVQFLTDVYSTQKYNTVPFYEQSAIIHVLKRYKERILSHPPQPFHSYITGCLDVKLGTHLAIFPTCRLNSNQGVDKADVERYSTTKTSSPSSIDVSEGVSSLSILPIFIFHAAGMKNKLGYIKAAIYKFHLEYDKTSVDIDTMVFAPIRSNLGHYRKELLELHLKYPKKLREGSQNTLPHAKKDATGHIDAQDVADDEGSGGLADILGDPQKGQHDEIIG